MIVRLRSLPLIIVGITVLGSIRHLGLTVMLEVAHALEWRG
jgi:hypothetical protein